MGVTWAEADSAATCFLYADEDDRQLENASPPYAGQQPVACRDYPSLVPTEQLEAIALDPLNMRPGAVFLTRSRASGCEQPARAAWIGSSQGGRWSSQAPNAATEPARSAQTCVCGPVAAESKTVT